MRELGPAKDLAPYAMLAELTHRCPLRCPYCSNPLELKARSEELETSDWLRVIEQAGDIGALQIHFSGGEPLLRSDLVSLVKRSAEMSLYSNLITSGIGLTAERLGQLKQAGLSSIQLSIQGTESVNDAIAGRTVFADKLKAAERILESALPLTLNVVIHRLNIAQLKEIIELGIECGAHKIELANAQYYGWALENRATLLPTKVQLELAEEVFRTYRRKLRGKVELIWVKSDYYEEYPKPCMGGWGQKQLTVAPDGTVYPCAAAQAIKSLNFSNVREHSLKWIWTESESFNAFRGFDWMKEPCVSCEYRSRDFGGCRCQAFLLTGDAQATDPVCSLSPQRSLIDGCIKEFSASTGWQNIIYREAPAAEVRKPQANRSVDE